MVDRFGSTLVDGGAHADRSASGLLAALAGLPAGGWGSRSLEGGESETTCGRIRAINRAYEFVQSKKQESKTFARNEGCEEIMGRTLRIWLLRHIEAKAARALDRGRFKSERERAAAARLLGMARLFREGK